MPAAVPVPSFGTLATSGGVTIQNADIDPYSTEDWFQAPLPLVLAFVTAANPIPLPAPAPAIPATAHGNVWFERIHVIPREKELGPVGSQVEFEVEVYSSFRNRAQIMDEITLTGTIVGITVVDHLGQPAHFAATQGELYTIQIAEEGDPVIDALVTWVFLGLESLGTDVHITGFRMIPVAFDPNMEDAIEEEYGYLTDVQEHYSGMEQRRQLREIPVGTVQYSLMHLTTRQAQMAAAILFGNQPRPFGVPRWQFQTPLTQPAAVDDVDIFCDPTDLPFEVGGIAFIRSDDLTYEAHKIDSILADRIKLSNGVALPWSAGAKIMPMVVGRLSPEETFSWESLVVGQQVLLFSIDGFKP